MDLINPSSARGLYGCPSAPTAGARRSPPVTRHLPLNAGRAAAPPALPVPDQALLNNASLFLDFDGTMVEIAAHPRAVHVDDRLRSLLARLSRKMAGRVAIISGRPIVQLDEFLGPSSMALAGSHGVEIRWPDGAITAPTRPAVLGKVIQEVTRLQKTHSGIVIERKPFGVAIHYRGEPRAEEPSRHLATALAASSGLVLQAGKMVFELRIPGADKGGALRTLLDSPSMAGTTPIFIGDDETDETAFVAATDLGGAGILVGPQRPTAALYRLDDVAATLAWLEAACGDRS